MSVNSTELGEWVDRVFAQIFFQPDEELCNKTLKESIDPELQVRVNGDTLPPEQWFKAVVEIRAKEHLSILSSREMLASRGAGKAGGTVAHLITFILTDKKTGAVKEESNLALATVVEKDGRRVITQLTEVFLAAAE